MARKAVAFFFSVCQLGSLSSARAAPGGPLEAAIASHLAGDLAVARSGYERALADEGLPRADHATAANNLCMLLPELGEPGDAVPACRRAVTLRRGGDPVPLARALNNLGIALLYTGSPGESGEVFREALEINRRHGETAAEADNLTHLGLVAEAQGRLSDALDLHLRSQSLAEASEAPWSAGRRFTALVNRGVVLEKLGQFRTALALYDDLLDLPDLDPRRRARLLVNTAALYRNLEDPLLSIEALEKARNLFKRSGDVGGLVDVFLNLGRTYHLNLRRPAEAERAFEQALERAREAGDLYGEVQAAFLLGELRLESPESPEESRALFELCLRSASLDRWPEALWSAHAGLAELDLAADDPAGALRHLETALEVVESVRRRVRGPRHRGSFFRDRRSIYDLAVEAHYRRMQDPKGAGTALDALQPVQRAKERELLEVLLQGPRSPTDGLDASALAEKLQGRGFLELWTTDDHLYRWLLLPSPGGHQDLDALSLERFELGPELRRLVATAGDLLAEGRELPPELLVSISERILPRPPASADGQWLVAADGPFLAFPFDVLPLPGDPDRRWVDVAELLYVPSASVPAALTTRNPERRLRFLGLADPELSPAAVAELGDTPRLRPLPAARREQEEAGRRLGGRFLTAAGAEADEVFLRQALRQHPAVLHLATHAAVQPEPGPGGVILLAGGDGDGAEADGLLRPEEIAELPGAPDLVVIAACRSALGAGRELGALGAFTGAFLANGSRGVLAVLWPVGDRESEIFMERFYARLARGATPARALADVKRLMRADPRWDHPRYWAPWVLWGDPPAVRPEKRPWWIVAGLGTAAVLLLAAAYSRLSRLRA